ncbi:hypothetical protein ACSES4_07680 [Pseudomonas aeruginosa]
MLRYSFGVLFFLVAIKATAVAGAESKIGVEGAINEEPSLGDPDYKLDSKYHPIYGALTGKSFYLHYCLPEFAPEAEGGCKAGIPGSIPDAVQVRYKYSLGDDSESPMLEGGGWFAFPFPVNVALEGKTPYIEQYKERERAVRNKSKKSAPQKVVSDVKFEGLIRYESSAMPKSAGWWVPEDMDEYRTRLGNPLVFSCSPHFCTLTLDQGNGWEVRATFNESALSDWRNFFVRFDASTKEIMEQYHGL